MHDTESESPLGPNKLNTAKYSQVAKHRKYFLISKNNTIIFIIPLFHLIKINNFHVINSMKCISIVVLTKRVGRV
jgi:hypothetical protein